MATRILAPGGASPSPLFMGAADLAAFAAWLAAQQQRALDGMTAAVQGPEGSFSKHCEQFEAATTARRVLFDFEVAAQMGVTQ